MAAISISNLSKHFKVLNRHEGLWGSIRDLFSRDYRIVRAVDGISMEIAEGEILGFLGPNGAGKSTTIKMLTGVLMPTSGQVRVNGLEPFQNRKKNAQNIGVVFGQRSQLWWELPAIESFRLLREIYRIPKRDYEENLDLFQDLVRIRDLYSVPVRNMSLGQRMLCDIVASFLHNPSVIFLDEPTIGLDISVKSKIRSLIRDLNTRKKTTILLTTHDISDIEALCRRIVIIDRGLIIYDGEIRTINRLFGNYRTLRIDPREDLDRESAEVKIRKKFRADMTVEKKVDGWVDITVDQERENLVDVMAFVMAELPVRDVKIEEIKTENVIRKIYEGVLK